jgi:ubiquinone/menaquinone biosynthesis C-methylase UbiE
MKIIMSNRSDNSTKNRFSAPSLVERVFGPDYILLDSVNEVFELELAHWECQTLTEHELLARSAFLKSIKGRNTDHYRLCQSFYEVAGEDRSSMTQTYFQEGRYSTGYATHGLFPYRGKFHPQLIKGLLNILAIRPGEKVLDPMCGSGTLNVEASLLGIDSIAVDISPFCQFMTKVKCQSLSMKPEALEPLINKPGKWFDFFSKQRAYNYLQRMEDPEKRDVYELCLLAFLDSMGYARRVVKSGHNELFEKVLRRYLTTVLHTARNPIIDRNALGQAIILDAEASNLPLENESIDCIITSPPYSFAIDYAENDAPQLDYLGVDLALLRSKMIGLKGRTKSDKLTRYFEDMRTVIHEIVRVLKIDKFAIMIIGSNTRQTGGIRLEKTMVDYFEDEGANLIRSILKPIKGMRNTMKEEFILIFQKKL